MVHTIRTTRRRPSTAPAALGAAAASAGCCCSRWCWSALRPATSMSAATRPSRYISLLLGGARDRWRCSACSRSPPASCGSVGSEGGSACSKRWSIAAFDAILITDRAGRVIYANGAYLAADRRRARARMCGRSSGSSSAIPMCRKRSTGCSRRRARASACRKRCGSRTARASRAAGCGCGCGRSARRNDARMTGLDGRRRHARAREAGKRLPGIAARDRLSRSRAGRLLLGRCARHDRLSQCDARRLARPRSRQVGSGGA